MPIIPDPADLRKQQELTSTIDRQIAALDIARTERRIRNQGREPERRGGIDRRGRVVPPAADVKIDREGV